jgi:hypothetical protein
MVGLVLRDQFQVIREREPVDGTPTVAVYADDVRGWPCTTHSPMQP